MKWLDLRGGVWLGLWSASVIAMSWFVVIADKGRDIPAGVVACYAAALTAFAGSNIAKAMKGGGREDKTNPGSSGGASGGGGD